MLPSFLPKTIPFFEMLEEQNKMLRAVSHEVSLLFSGKSEPEACGGAVARLEAEADQKHRNIVRSLSQTFITPIDREDILRIDQGQGLSSAGLIASVSLPPRSSRTSTLCLS